MEETINKETEALRKSIANAVLDERGYALVWMSAGNPYFKEEIIKRILDFTGKHFAKTIVMAPDEPAEHTFKAIGYKGNEIKRKARLNANLLQNRAKRVVDSSNFRTSLKFRIVEWIEEVIPNKFYNEKLREINELYKRNKSFEVDARETTKRVLLSKSQGNLELDWAIDEGVNYLLKELAFVLASPFIYKIKKVNYVYHNEWPIFQKLIAGHYDGIVRENLNFVLFK